MIGTKLCSVEAVLQFFEMYTIDLKDCRGQTYDNASNIAGTYAGLQARIKLLNILTEFIPCSGHSLNLVGVQRLVIHLLWGGYYVFPE